MKFVTVQSGEVKSSLCAFEDRQAPSASFWEIVEVVCRSSVVDSGRILITKNLSPCSHLTLYVQEGVLSSSKSSAYSGGGLDWQILVALVSLFFHNTCSFCIMWHFLYWGGIGLSILLWFAN